MSQSEAAARLERVAREYCEFIESFDTAVPEADSHAFLAGLSRLLPRLHAAIEALDAPGRGEDLLSDIDPERRFVLFSRLHQALGELDAYWTEFDLERHGAQRSGSLADDLADIYWELRAGLDRLAREPAAAPVLRCWRAGYRLHWGRHLVDAERHLYDLSVRDAF